MKVIIGNSLYVQKKDIMFLKKVNILLPDSIVYDNLITNFKKGNEFIKIDNIDDIEFFQNLDFIVDYNLYKDITLEEYEKIDLEISSQISDIESKFDSMVEFEAMENLYLIDEVEKLEYKREELMNILRFRHGCIEIILSDDIDYFDRYKNKRKRRIRRFNK